ncbi:DUF2156 domain-containing protein [Porphyromonas endodontalis]|uniref:DUF2156 domain-containing protein n=1 Tax=Porphyromonas endodontalis TaxID=28124 RepID=UPI0028EF3C6D|nr:DUF2156 domain-containing protein [Porphyromonas endodontalis]
MCQLRFRPITLEDRDIIFPLIYKDDKAICDLSFTNLYGWSERYETSWTIYQERVLIIRFRSPLRSHPVFLLPYCTERALWQGAINELIHYAEKEGFPLVCMGVTEGCAKSLEQDFGQDFQFFWDEDYADYVYLRERLVSLSGKKLQSKRNHINKFKKLYPDYTYRPFTPNQKELYKDFADQWLDDTTQRDGIQEENRMVHRILDACEVLQLQGGALWIEGKIVAMTLGSPINHNTFDVHVEKANPAIEGAYTVINNEFAKQIPEQYIYINREEDLGIPGLRFAKESYQPELRLYKGTALLRRHAQV